MSPYLALLAAYAIVVILIGIGVQIAAHAYRADLAAAAEAERLADGRWYAAEQAYDEIYSRWDEREDFLAAVVRERDALLQRYAAPPMDIDEPTAELPAYQAALAATTRPPLRVAA